MILAYAIAAVLLTIGITTTIILDTKIISEKPDSISPTSEVTNDISKYIEGRTESLFFLYGYVIPVSTYLSFPKWLGLLFSYVTLMIRLEG
jgi:hypothetical protein